VYVSAALLIVLAVLNLATHGALGPLTEVPGLGGLPQLAAPYSSPSNFSFALSIAALVAYGRWTESRRKVHLMIAATLVVAVAFALCRAAILGLILGFVVFSVVGRPAAGRRLLLALAGAVLVFATLFSVPEFRHRMFFDPDSLSWASVLDDPASILEHLDTSGRDGLWTAAREDFRDRSIWVGSGIGSVDRWIRDRDVRGAELHSDVFRLYLDLGILGLGLFVAAFVSMARRMTRSLRGRRRDPRQGLPIERIALGALACYAATLPTDNSLNYVANFGVLVYGLVGLALAHPPVRVTAAAAVPIPPAPRRFAQILE
jgi:O-antigen ligase